MSVTTTAEPVVETERLQVNLGGIPVLREVTVTIAAGEIVALMGGNGSGKTTLIRALLGLTPVQSGSVRLFGIPLAAFRQWGRIGYVPQRGAVAIRHATVTEVVATGRLAHRRPFVPAGRADRDLVTCALDQVGLVDRARTPFANLSGGQQQRVLIARALASQADLLVLDEPFAGVDLGVQESLASLLGRLNAEGRTILVVLHETGALGPLLDRAILMREGRVALDGPPPPDLGHGHEISWPLSSEPLVTGAIDGET